MAKGKKVDEAVEVVKEEVEAVETVKAEAVVDESPKAVEKPVEVAVAKIEQAIAKSGISISSSTLKSQNVAVSAGVVAFDKDGNAVVSESVLKAITPFFDAFKIVVRK